MRAAPVKDRIWWNTVRGRGCEDGADRQRTIPPDQGKVRLAVDPLCTKEIETS